MKSEPIILLTASINPNGMVDTLLQDPNIRMTQYLSAIEYYLNNTSLKIVFCENTMVDIYHKIKHPNKIERLKYICFDGNKKKNYGKSLGELEIILYAINNSKFINKESIIIKITGRIIIKNIKELIVCIRFNRIFPFIYIELPHRFYSNTVCFATNYQILFMCLTKYGILIKEKNYDFERLMFSFLVNNKIIKIIEWHPYIIGICGTYNKPYINGNILLRKLFHKNSLLLLKFVQYKDKKISLKKYILNIYYYFSLLIRFLYINYLKLINRIYHIK